MEDDHGNNHRPTPWSAEEARVQLMDLGGPGVVILGWYDGRHFGLTIGVSQELREQISAGDILAYVSP